MPLPFFEAFALGALDREESSPRLPSGGEMRIDRRHIYDATIPAYRLRDRARRPARADPHARHPAAARRPPGPVGRTTVRRLLEVVFNSPFAQVIRPPLDARLLELPPELPWHDGTTEFIRRNSPLIAGDVIEQLEKEVSIIGVLAGGILCLVQWLRRRYAIGGATGDSRRTS